MSDAFTFTSAVFAWADSTSAGAAAVGFSFVLSGAVVEGAQSTFQRQQSKNAQCQQSTNAQRQQSKISLYAAPET